MRRWRHARIATTGIGIEEGSRVRGGGGGGGGGDDYGYSSSIDRQLQERRGSWLRSLLLVSSRLVSESWLGAVHSGSSSGLIKRFTRHISPLSLHKNIHTHGYLYLPNCCMQMLQCLFLSIPPYSRLDSSKCSAPAPPAPPPFPTSKSRTICAVRRTVSRSCWCSITKWCDVQQ